MDTDLEEQLKASLEQVRRTPDNRTVAAKQERDPLELARSGGWAGIPSEPLEPEPDQDAAELEADMVAWQAEWAAAVEQRDQRIQEQAAEIQRLNHQIITIGRLWRRFKG